MLTSKLTRCKALGLLAIAACGPQTAGETETDGEPGTGATTKTTAATGEAPTTGAEPPAVDCDALPTVLDSPQWQFELEPTPASVAAAPNGDVVFLANSTVYRRSAGMPVWLQPFEEGETLTALATWPDGQVIAGGFADEGARLVKLGAAGERLAAQTHDLSPGTEPIVAVAAGPAGEVFSVSHVFTAAQTNALRLDRFDAALAHVWSLELSSSGFTPAVAVDAAGDAYVATVDIAASDEFSYTWALQVHAVAGDGTLRWTSDPRQLVTERELVKVEIDVGDQVYALVANRWGFALQAFSPAGAPAWDIGKDVDDAGDHVLHALAASPCGGVYVGGRSDVEVDSISERASLFHVAADGTFGPVTTILDDSQDGAYEFGETTELALSPPGRIVAAGTLRPLDPEGEVQYWMRSF